MLRKIKDFQNLWTYESDATLKVFNRITDETMHKNIRGYNRTIGLLAWHSTVWMGAISKQAGLNVSCPDYDSEAAKTVSELIETYKVVSGSIANEIKNNWTDKSLLMENNIFGKTWKNGKTLSSIISHQIHHRAQITVIMRILGLKAPGIYGPSKEEWSELGMEIQK